MYKFYKIFPNGTEKYCETFNSTLDLDYHAYINWCNENNIGWKLIRVFDNVTMFENKIIIDEKLK